MARTAVTLSHFFGGEISPDAKGRFDWPQYHGSFSTLLNWIIAEEGACVRRSGTEWMGPTYKRQAAKLLPFMSNAANPFLLEFTDGASHAGALRFWYNTGPVCTNDRQVLTASSSSAGVLTLTTTTAHGWSAGDHIVLFCPSTLTYANRIVVQNRQLLISAVTSNTVTCADDKGNALPSDISSGGLNGATAFRILRFDSTGIPAANLPNIRVVQAQTQGIVLSSAAAPHVLSITTDLTAGSDSDPVFSYSSASFIDGPYLDPQPGGGTVSAYTGTITFTPTDGTTFTSTDVGRLVRLFSQPAAYNSGTAYSVGNTVTDATGLWYLNVYPVTGVPPGATTTVGGVVYIPWVPAPTAGQWAWGTIATQSGTSCTIALSTNLNSANGTTISQWQLGVYKSGQYPTVGIYHEGRLWLGGAIPNRFDASMSNALLTFSPTDIYNNQNDNNSIAVTLNFNELTSLYWMIPIGSGILAGTNGGEILISASALGDPLTPSSIQAHRVTSYRAANVEPRQAGLSTLFAQRYTQRLLEYVETFNFSGLGFAARHLNEFSKHITAAGIKELAYQEEKAPVVWALMTDGTIAGCTYRRVSKFVTEPPVMQAWWRLSIGDGSTVNSMAVLPGVSGLSDQVYLNTEDSNGDFWVETVRPIFEDI